MKLQKIVYLILGLALTPVVIAQSGPLTKLQAPQGPKKAPRLDAPAADLQGNPLPVGALARLGSGTRLPASKLACSLRTTDTFSPWPFHATAETCFPPSSCPRLTTRC